MPQKVDEIVDALLSDPDFYPEKSEKQQKAIAWATAWSQYNKKHKRKTKSLSSLDRIIQACENFGFQKEANELHSVFIKVAQSQDYPKIFKFINNPPNIIVFAEDPGPYYVFQDAQRTNFSASTVEEAVSLAKDNFPNEEIAFVYMLDVNNDLRKNPNYGMSTKPAFYYYNGQSMNFPAVEECRDASLQHASELRQNLGIRVVPIRSGYFVQEQDRITRAVDIQDEYPTRRY